MGERLTPVGGNRRRHRMDGQGHRIKLRQKAHPPGIAAKGTKAELKNIIGRERKPSTEKKSPWLFTENAIAIEMAVKPTPNIIPINKMVAIPSRPVAGCTPKRNATPRMTNT